MTSLSMIPRPLLYALTGAALSATCESSEPDPVVAPMELEAAQQQTAATFRDAQQGAFWACMDEHRALEASISNIPRWQVQLGEAEQAYCWVESRNPETDS